MRAARVGGLVVATTLLVAGCGSKQNSLDAHSEPAKEIASLWWWMLGGLSFGFSVICGLLIAAWVRRRRSDIPGGRDPERVGWGVVLTLGFIVPIVGLAALFLYADIFVIRSTQAPAAGTTQMTVKVVARQFWWEARYPGTTAVTANEIHIPVRTRVNLLFTTGDVIHTFWVPQLNRKVDAIPGQTNRLLLYADEVGRYRGQCAEFCGLQHAHMALYVYAEPQAKFRAWLRREAQPIRSTQSTPRGFRIFTSAGCDTCHRIRGTAAHGFSGPDLTHVGSRETIGALVLPNDREHMAEWIRNSQYWKPGNRMPNFRLPPQQLDALVAYLEGLK
jgi:cytochrome c oxidase subunit II